MKTKLMIIPVIALALGCSREIDTNVTYIDGEFTLYATSGENDTRTVFQPDGRVFWSPSDCITVFYGNVAGKFTSTNTEPAASAKFTGSLGSFAIDGKTEFRAIYPHSNDIVTPTDEGILSIFLPSEQTGVEGTFADDLFICVAKSKDVNLHFYNVCGGVKFSLARGDIKKVVFRGNNGETLAGRMAVEFDSNGIPQVTDMTGGKSSVTLVAPDGGTFKEGAYYYLVLVPQSLTKGYTMELWTDELVETISSEASVTIRRAALGVLKNLGNNDSPMAIPEAIDLGLPSGLLWASFNLGATKPEESGDYYAWGETATKEDYSEATYKWIQEGQSNGRYIFKYTCADGQTFGIWYDSNGNFIGDGKTSLADYDYVDDPARAILGDSWRIPTDAEWAWLLENCSWTWTDDYKGSGVAGRIVTSNIPGYEDNSIFLPAGGFRIESSWNYAGVIGCYWSSSLYEGTSTAAWGVLFDADNGYRSHPSRYQGLSVRPVLGEPLIPVGNVSLDKTEIILSVGETSTLSATVLPDNATDKTVTWSSSKTSVATVSPSGVVAGVSSGYAVITVTTIDGGKTATCSVTVKDESSPSMAVPEAIDLGLPSGLKWASFNLGASKPEEYGDYYAWGETEPYFSSLDPLTWKEGKGGGYAWSSYKWCMGTSNTMTKYCSDSSYGYNGFTDNKTVLDLEDDAAHVNLGGTWRMPTDAEWNELLENCTWTWTTKNGENGRLVTGSNGNSIFLPAAGGRYDANLYNVGSSGYYWSSSLRTDYPLSAWRVRFNSGSVYWSSSNRYYGFSVRPVYDDSSKMPEIEVSPTDIEFGAVPYGTSSTKYVTVKNIGSGVLSFTVENVSAPFSVTPTSYSLSAGESVQLAFTFTPVSATSGAGGRCTIVSNATQSVVSVTYSGSGTESGVSTPEAVDLGLPSGLKWASFNLGATKPEEYGDYYAWGETETYYSSLDPLTWKDGKEEYGYFWRSYKWSMGDDSTLTKYCNFSESGYNGFMDSKTVLDPEDDAAHVNLGGSWRMPTDDEWTELREHCTWTWTSLNGVTGGIVTGPNGNSIFFPAAGNWFITNFLSVGSGCYFWSSSLDTDGPGNAWHVLFVADEVYRLSYYRFGGQSVRPVCE